LVARAEATYPERAVVRIADVGELAGLDPRTRSAATALIVSARTPVDATILDLLPALEVVTSYGVGYDHLDLARLRARGIEVSNTPGVLDDCVAAWPSAPSSPYVAAWWRPTGSSGRAAGRTDMRSRSAAA
jgi:lactate dehydrogenase-like 2-hydroxyacid dehydrogenase